MKLNQLSDNRGARKKRTRVGRGPASGTGRTAIAGATDTNYTITAASVADDRTIYSVDVINSQGVATSDEVVLRVVEILVGTQLLAEDFNGVPLGPPVDEATCVDVWSPDPPTGWALDNSGVPGFGDPATDGVREFAGWNFMDLTWYVDTAGNQGRDAFTLGTGVVAVATVNRLFRIPVMGFPHAQGVAFQVGERALFCGDGR